MKQVNIVLANQITNKLNKLKPNKMKTTKSLSGQLSSAITCFALFATTSLFITSCQKEELTDPQTATINERTKNPAVKPVQLGKPQTATVNSKVVNPAMLHLVFKSIKIDHISGRGDLSDYSITVRSNGTATYAVHVKEREISRDFRVSLSELRQINNLCIQYIEYADYADVDNAAKKFPQPMVVTTYTSAIKGGDKILRDFNGKPEWLVLFRTEVEKVINITQTKGTQGSLAEVNQ